MKQISVLGSSQKPLKALKPKSTLRHVVFAGLVMSSVSIIAQAAVPSNQGPAAFTLKVITHGEGDNRSDNFSEPRRQDNRRADVTIKTQVQASTRTVNTEVVDQVQVKVSEASNRSIRLNDGGVIWVSKDPASLTPVLNVTAPSSASMENGQLVNPINFAITTNYDYFIDSWELEIYHSDDQQQKHPLKTFEGRSLKGGESAKWDGISESGKTINEGDTLSYVLKVKDKEGHLDRTYSRDITIVGPQRNITDTSVALSNLEDNLELQTIPVSGSRVRIFGRDIPSANSVAIDGNRVSLVESKFVVEKLLPEGQHDFNVAITNSQQQTYTKPLNVDVKSKYMFIVGLADVTVGEGSVSDNLETLTDGDRNLDGDIFVDGRLAFYLKGKIKGKYLITAQMDTGTQEIDELFDDIHEKDAESVFRRLDPDEYYPVYGDDSTIIDDTDSQGKVYVRVDWDKSRALWGNYNTAITGTELSSFNRSLYGAKLDYRGTKTTTDGDHKVALTAFGSEAQSAFRHNEFLGTGGSLYYLNDTDIVDGSEKIWIEIREDATSDRVVERVELVEGRDYQIDDFQGRIILNRPLLQIAEQSYPSLIKDDPLDGDQVYLMVDYEYVPDDFDTDKASYGGRGKVWLNDHIGLGGTFVHENRDNDDYELKGVDVTFKKSKGTYIKAEYAESESNQTDGSFTSTDGGLNFNPFDSNEDDETDDSKGEAYSVEGRVDLSDISSLDGSIGAWFKSRDEDFASANLDTGYDTTDTGIEIVAKVTDNIGLSAKATEYEQEDFYKETTASLKADVRVNDKLTLAAEVKHVEEEDLAGAGAADGEGTLGAFKVGYDVTKEINLYGIAQGTIESEGEYEDNDLLTLGVKAKVNSKLDLNAEVSSGDRGDSALIGANYRMTDSYSLYTNVTHSTDTTADKQQAFTIGQRKSVSDQLKVYTEHQFTHEDDESGVGHTFGLDYKVSKELTASFSAQSARLDGDNGLTDRDAFTVGLSYQEDRIDASTRLEYRLDDADGDETEQWVTTNRVNYRVNPSLRLQAKLNHSDTKDKNGNSLDARFTEAGLGFAYRPVEHDRHNVLGRITYLYDLQPLNQSDNTDERSLIASLENSYQVNQRWEVGGKLAHRESETRLDRDAGEWVSNDASLAAVRVRYHMTENWDALAQYHWLNSDESGTTQHGAMVSVDRHIGKNFKVGVGYNFTDFDDDLSNEDGTSEGWFLNLVGKY